jgi:hypothetical protein
MSTKPISWVVGISTGLGVVTGMIAEAVGAGRVVTIVVSAVAGIVYCTIGQAIATSRTETKT